MTGAGTLAVAAPAPGPACGEAPRVRSEDFERVEDYLHAYLEDERFRSRYPLAHERWRDASAMLWRADSTAKVIGVARTAREAMRDFACVLVGWRAPHASLPDSTDTMLRLASVVERYRRQVGEERCGMQEALLYFWNAVCNTVERHEHPAQRMHGRLRWEDGRRVVTLTALVMVEIDRCL